jgi:hypothetical protein
VEIRQFAQGEADATLFALVGPWLSSREVHVQQDGAVTSEPGDLWHVGIESGVAVGFALTHPTPAGAHIKNVYAEQPRARDQLLKAVLKVIDALEVPRAYSVGRLSDELWERNGFTFHTKRGAFGTWER